MKSLKIAFLLLLFLGVNFGCKKDDPIEESEEQTVTDIDGFVYETVTIGSQVWMTENLKTYSYRNGEPILQHSKVEEWVDLEYGVTCTYNKDAIIAEKYGRIYSSKAVTDPRGIAPVGWRIATDEDWNILRTYVEANLGESGGMGAALSAPSDWKYHRVPGCPGYDFTKNNSSGFSALPGGKLRDGEFSRLSETAYWWSKPRSGDELGIWNLDFGGNGQSVLYGGHMVNRGEGYYIRCVKITY